MKPLHRRDFLRTTGAAAGAVALTGTLRSAQSSPNDTIRMGIIGLRGRGNSHLRGFEGVPGVEVVALCDVDEAILAGRKAEHEKRTGRSIATYTDLRKMFDDTSINAVSIATPNHWHSLAGIWAMQSGKDVYVEKPLSHNVWEGRQLVRTARRHQRMCQHGVQGRSSPAIREAIQHLRDGVIGDVYMAKGLCYKWRNTIGRKPDAAAPSGVHYDTWLGPAPDRPFSENRFHYNWHWHWDYGNGDIGNQGVHEMDLARWGLGVGLPKKISSLGGRFLFDDDKEVPNTQLASFYYPEENRMLVFEVRHWITNYEGSFGNPGGNNVGVIFYGSEGIMTLKYFEYRVFLGRKHEPGPSGGGAGSEWKTFIAGVRSRRISDLGTDVEDGHLSSSLCHLANISYRLGRTIDFDPKTERCPNDGEADRMLSRPYRSPFVVPAEV